MNVHFYLANQFTKTAYVNFIPRIGEVVVLQGHAYRVTSVQHQFGFTHEAIISLEQI